MQTREMYPHITKFIGHTLSNVRPDHNSKFFIIRTHPVYTVFRFINLRKPTQADNSKGNNKPVDMRPRFSHQVIQVSFTQIRPSQFSTS